MNTTRKKIRTLIIAIVFIIIAIMSILHFSVEPADYKKEIIKQNAAANELIANAVDGNDNNQYSHNSILRLKSTVNYSQKLISEMAPDIEALRNAYNFAKKEISLFKESKNKNSLSKDAVLKCKNDKTDISKTQKIGDNEISLTIPYDGINEPIAVNFDVKSDGMYSSRIDNLLKAQKLQGFSLEFEHSGNFPGRMDVSLNSEKIPPAAYLYRYNRNSNSMDYICTISVDKSNAKFSITMGGDFILTNKAPDIKQDAQTQEEEIAPNDKINKEETAVSSNNNANNTPSKASSKQASKPAASKAHSSQSASSIAVSSAASQKLEEEATPPEHDLTIDEVLPDNEQKPVKKNKCSVEIRCDTILSNIDKLDKGLEKYVPASGEILKTVEIEFTDGESAFDVIKRAARSFNIQMEFRDDPSYSGAYIEGINHLYEFSCGAGSGWMYMINGWFPNYGCSQYQLQDGDSMVWAYTCDVGQDIGKG